MGIREDVAKDVAQVSPALAGTGGLYIMGLPLAEWTAIATFVLVVLQVAYRTWKWRKEIRDDKKASSRG